ncbi:MULTISPECIES: CoA transferase [unclassified Pseudonocardia]|uniref:CaiB/BaiF CoA transferase family protein n=1 Tax=unclassified Pseudonocardia TaxID=2619320 RepID=UPI0001FFEBC7|nr:CoA transferase [Pseudonocardia sp. Ae707_Ps1]OLM19931.1 CAIB/BAIF family protein [Pseudonocardia sp. Ae707_Ps1]
MSSALDGMVVLDLTSYLAGPYGCALLGDQGADVIKVESPDGDMMRRYPSTLKGENRAVLGANRNKRSIRLDLKSEQGREAFLRMVAAADVVVHNFRPGVAESLGIGYEALRAVREDLVYCSLTGYGNGDGPMRRHPGYDQMLQCFTGMAMAQGLSVGSPQILRGSIVDFYASALLAQGVIAALLHRYRTGAGQHVEISLLRSAIALQVGRFVWADSEPRDVQREPDSSQASGAVETKEGYLYFQAGTAKFWTAFCEAIGLPELADDPRYDTLVKRAQHGATLMPQIKQALLARTAVEWEQEMVGRVPVVALRDIGEMFEHPQVLAEGLVTEHDHPEVGRYRTMTTAVKMGAGDPVTTRAPLAGEHTDEILGRFDFSAAEVEQLRRARAAS